jgi:hypothetical protein
MLEVMFNAPSDQHQKTLLVDRAFAQEHFERSAEARALKVA